MAVTNFHYITRMNSGFKVYILEGQPNLRGEDRFRHMTSERVRVLPAHPVKRKHSAEYGRTLEERRERALSKSLVLSGGRRASVFSLPESPTSTWSPTSSPTHPIPSPVCSTPTMDEPLALIKKPRQDQEKTEDRIKTPASSHIQIRPSVITCVSSTVKSTRRVDDCRGHSTVTTKRSYDRVVEEHFQRSLGANYSKTSSELYFSSVSVDDHFAKALGDKWLQLKASSSSRASSTSSSSSSPPSSPSYIHSPGYGQSPKRARKDSSSPSAASATLWSVK
ncbi:vestigial like 4 like [Chanos chanos]|uniref:Vestigial like 4 like n=1 Tax=Chanos chanos TaxID=29144 RepID=A0A6J2WR18_CHACN|nr:transcription cofactor vestigial-like protein 4 [Chanos chanos]